MSIRYACARCRKLITDWRATVDAPTGRVTVTGHCHGETFPITQIIESEGVAFHGLRTVLDLESRNPDDWIEKEGPDSDRRSGRRSSESR